MRDGAWACACGRACSGLAESEWIHTGKGSRVSRPLRRATLVMLPCGQPLALLPAGLTTEERNDAYCRLWWEYSIRYYGVPIVRERLRALMSDATAA